MPPPTTRLDAARRHERDGEWADAKACYESAFQEAARLAEVGTASLALLGVARVHLQACAREVAEEVASLAIHVASAGGHAIGAARATNLVGVIRHQHGEWRLAAESYHRALDLARDAGDDELIGAITQNLGVICNSLGDVREARALYLEGIGACVRGRSAQMAASSYNNLGLVSADLGEWTEAEVHFLRGIEISERLGDRALCARILTGRAEPLVRTGEFERARRSLSHAEEIARDLGDAKSLADIDRYRGMSARLQGRALEAEDHLDRAIATAREAKLELEEAEALEELARLRESQDRLGAARIVLREARRLYESLGARRDLDRVEALAAAWESKRRAARAEAQ